MLRQFVINLPGSRPTPFIRRVSRFVLACTVSVLTLSFTSGDGSTHTATMTSPTSCQAPEVTAMTPAPALPHDGVFMTTENNSPADVIIPAIDDLPPVAKNNAAPPPPAYNYFGKAGVAEYVFYTTAIDVSEADLSLNVAPRQTNDLSFPKKPSEWMAVRGSSAKTLENRFRPDKFSAGVTVAGKGTMLMNNGANDGPGLDTGFGLTIRYNHNYRWSFTGGCFLRSGISQPVSVYSEGLRTGSKYELDWFSFELGARYRLDRPSKIIRPGFYVVGGAFVSGLASATLSADGISNDISSSFSNKDYGVLCGGEVDFPVLHRFVLTPGVIFKYGIPDISTGASPELAASLHTVAVELRVSLTIPFNTRLYSFNRGPEGFYL